ncbi:hypothetical protein ACH4C6_33915 [Streptomyces sp. NPDC017943]|uniref:hypothetical protein n=1 Tax=Streptomyces sp. NPDC017943 TaxID=3365019 RepID=UPI0037B6F6EF
MGAEASQRDDRLPPLSEKPSLFDRAKSAARDAWKWAKERSGTVTRHFKKPWVLGAIGLGLVAVGAASGFGLAIVAGAAIIGAGAGALYQVHRKQQRNKVKLQEAQLQQFREGTSWGMNAPAPAHIAAGFAQAQHTSPAPTVMTQMAAHAPTAAHPVQETVKLPEPAYLPGSDFASTIASLRSSDLPIAPSGQQDQPAPSHRPAASTKAMRRGSI